MQHRLIKVLFGTAQNHVIGYDEVAWRAAWIFTAILTVSYASYLYFGSLHAALAEPVKEVAIIQEWRPPDEHRVRGYVPLPTECHRVSVHNEQISEKEFEIMLTSWQEPSRTCLSKEVLQQFATVLFTPHEFITIRASLDGVAIPVTIEK